ncbi:RluA family pseudouridine synthase [uncultured Megasphaera sp.]|uniref:RluA family pseudouridine synthase n=1 Tax=Megasphaera massiliensis TaxID=1232428 RepID=UPI00266CC167|nr:RluA family pseudouridine synthase [uncultured Megasphaera sp.]
MIHFTVGPLHRPTTVAGAMKHFGVSSTLRRRIKHSGSCTINGQPASTRDFVHEGDVVSIVIPVKNEFAPEDIPIGIVYEDDYLMVIDKPAGILMHPTSAVRDGTLANAVAYHYEKTGQHCSYHPMHRLDKNTSGLCMVAKEPQIQYAFDKKDLSYKRLYLAICQGRYPARVTTVHAPIGRCPDSIITRCVRLDGKPAHSDFTCLARSDEYSLLQVVLHTGRTHQIRVHSSYLGYPLLGDDLYGGSRRLIQRQALHAYCLQFTHPMTHRFITVNSRLPEDMDALVRQAGWNYIH